MMMNRLTRALLPWALPRTAACSSWMNVRSTRLLSNSLFDLSAMRNVAIVAHVDHGKTSLVDQLLKQSGNKQGENRLLDSNTLEKERGITIVSKCTRIERDGMCFNIVDTPGHADFGGEVERVLSMVEGVVLVVDASEGPMPQTKFVLKKALESNLIPLVVINKVDRKDTRRVNGEVENELFDLFCNLDANDEQLDFPILYCSAKEGWAVTELEHENNENKNMECLFDAIKKRIPAPKCDRDAPLKFIVTSIEKDDYVGKILSGKIVSGSMKEGTPIKTLTREGKLVAHGEVTKLMVTRGISKSPIDVGLAGDIISVAGVEGGVSDTVVAPDVTEPIQTRPIDPPTITMTFSVADSPLAGKEGKFLTSNVIKDRLVKETENNVTIQLRNSSVGDAIEVQGRGELQMGILIETMRREGFEFNVSPPRVLYKRDPETKDVLEPWEEVTIDVETTLSSKVMDKMTRRGAEVVEFVERGTRSRMIFLCPSRKLMGFQSEFTMETRGDGVVCSIFHSYRPRATIETSLRKGVIVSTAQGVTTGHALASVEARGTLFIHPGDAVYEGMVIGECSRDDDLDVNPVRCKKLTNVRSSGAEEKIRLTPPREMSIEDYLTYMAPDEKLEVTPKSIRLRKETLSGEERKRLIRTKRKAEEIFI